MQDIGMAIRGRKIKMEYVITQIATNDIYQDILEDMLNQSLDYIDTDPPNMCWEEFQVLPSSPDAHKYQAIEDWFMEAPIIYKVEIDGYIVMYGSGRREIEGQGMFCACVDMMRADESGSNAWSYSMEWTEAADAFYKSISDGIPETSTWVVEGSSMDIAYSNSVNPNDDGDIQNLSVVNTETIEDHYGHTLRKLVIIRNT